MHHPRLHPFASSWPQAVADIVQAALESGEVSAQELRTIIIGPTADWLTLGVWLGTEWEEHPSASGDEQCAGRVDLGPWLDAVDAVTRGERTLAPAAGSHVPRIGVRFADPAKQASLRAAYGQLRESLLATAVDVGTTKLAGPFKKPVGLFILDESDSSAQLAAFAHPHGAPLLPLQEQRKEHGYGSAYPQGVLVDHGLVIFYPEGDGEGTSSKKRAPRVGTMRFDDMAHARIDDGDGELHIRMKGEVFDVSLRPGHTREDDGGLHPDEVAAALQQHFRSRRPALFQQEHARYALPSDSTALEAFLASFGEDHEKRSAVEKLIEMHGVDVVDALCAGAVIDGPVRSMLHGELARAYLKLGRAQEALAHLEKQPEDHRSILRTAEAYCRLGRYEAVLALPQDRNSRELRILALAHSGRLDEALALATESGALDDDDCQYARALVLANAGRSDVARDVLREAFVLGSPTGYLESLLLESPLAGLWAERVAWEQRRAA